MIYFFQTDVRDLIKAGALEKEKGWAEQDGRRVLQLMKKVSDLQYFIVFFNTNFNNSYSLKKKTTFSYHC